MMPFLTICKHSIILISLTALSQALWSEAKTIRIKVPEGYDEITYDASRVNLQNLNRWVTLSPVLSQNNGYLVPEDPLLCDIKDPAYTGCGREQVWLNINNAKHSQQKIQERLERLNREQFPPEFAPIVSYFRAVQSFALWRNQQEINYFETRNIASIEKAYTPLGLDAKVSCVGVLEQIRNSSNQLRAWNLVVNDWHNCMWQEFTKATGEYPQQAWDTALKVQGIREHLVVQEN
jgi:hypothetical protein